MEDRKERRSPLPQWGCTSSDCQHCAIGQTGGKHSRWNITALHPYTAPGMRGEGGTASITSRLMERNPAMGLLSREEGRTTATLPGSASVMTSTNTVLNARQRVLWILRDLGGAVTEYKSLRQTSRGTPRITTAPKSPTIQATATEPSRQERSRKHASCIPYGA